MITKDIEGYEGIYEITEDGRVFRKERISKVTSKTRGVYYKNIKRKELSKALSQDGYERICLFKDKVKKTVQVHRAVAEAFILNFENKPQVNHKNGVKTDNQVSNLEWCTPSENLRHAYDNNLARARKGTDVKNSKLNENNVREIREMYDSGIIQRKIAEKFNVSVSAIKDVLKGKNWKHVK